MTNYEHKFYMDDSSSESDEDQSDFFILTRIYRDKHNPLDYCHNVKEFIDFYRFPRSKMIELIDLLSKSIYSPVRNRKADADDILQISIALKFFAFGSRFRDLAELFHVDKSTISHSVAKVTDALLRVMPNFVKFPEEDEILTSKQKFFDISDIPNVIGAVDGTHIKIVNVPLEREAIYVNRKHYHSINVQIVADSDLRIINAVAKWPGSTHDAFILRQSELYDRFERGLIRGLLLGDSAYPLKCWLLTPFLNPKNEAEVRYNDAQKRQRNLVERTIGVLKNRFRCLHETSPLWLLPEKAVKVITAVIVLHNIAVQMKIPDVDFTQEVNDDICDITNEIPSDVAKNARQYIVEKYFS